MYLCTELVHTLHVFFKSNYGLVPKNTHSIYVMQLYLNQLIYVYSYSVCAVWLHKKVTPLTAFKCVSVHVCAKNHLLEFVRLSSWYLVWFTRIIKCVYGIFCVCVFVCVQKMQTICFWWLHFVNWFMFIHLLLRRGNSEPTFCFLSG